MIRKLIRRVVRLGILAGLAVGFYFFGRVYLWPPQDRSKIEVVGMIEAPEVNITSLIAGRIKQLDLIEGDRVTKGQVVCQIEDIDLRNQLAKSSAELAHAEANLAQAQRDLNRDIQLFQEHVIANKVRDDALTAVEQSQAEVLSARANLKYFEDQLADTQIKAPADGVIVSKALEVGEWVTPGTPILTVDDLSTIWARVDVGETDLGSLYIGKSAQITLPTEPPQIFSGQVIAIGQEGQFATQRDVRRGRQDIRTFYVKVKVLQADGQLKPGMTAEVTFPRIDGTRLTRNSHE
ncbi:MAG: efflux RND transporter periplasmic adaptor subunit [Candidatus Binatus sp.]|uniref:efflux RND transporter periplasmic adaptor subunit n=1 Tax=Candidatus Binatus sp. TaxID=2811406 RepID=UPI00271C804A|nr:efflux RND transporter periplasmic adaptor subunit [Candidatus Binatus sp.]MDO8432757.1 efflux RND transporter periplasmic adaptor subunit [Candidatus Binatus sp.]